MLPSLVAGISRVNYDATPYTLHAAQTGILYRADQTALFI